MTTPLGIGLIGCGRIAEVAWAPAIELESGARLAAVCDDVGSRATSLADGAPIFSDPAELVNADGVDAVVIATPATTHLILARLASDAGIPAIVEKPPAASLAEAQALTALERKPWVGFNRRFDPRIAPIAGTRPDEFPLRLDAELRYRRSAWGSHDPAGDDALLDLGSHLVDLALFLLGGELVRVRARLITGERATVELETERGRANLEAATDRRFSERIVLRDSAFLVGRSERGGVRDALRGLVGSDPHPLLTSVGGQLRAFVGAARGGDGGSLAQAVDGVRAMVAIEGARRSHAGGGDWVEP